MATHNSELTLSTLDKVERAYDSQPWWYDLRGFFILTFTYRSTLWEQVRLFGGNIGNRHLDVAIGTGTLFDIILRWRDWLKAPACEIVGIDYAEPMLAGARRRFSKRTNIMLERCDVAALPHADNSFDSANIANAVHCFPDVDAGLTEVHRVLKPGAKLAFNALLFPKGRGLWSQISTRINQWGMNKGILHTPYHADDMRKRIVSAGFEIQSEIRRGNTLNVVAVKPDASKTQNRGGLV